MERIFNPDDGIRVICRLLAVLTVLFTTGASAENMRLADCREMDDGEERLACYDSVAEPASDWLVSDRGQGTRILRPFEASRPWTLTLTARHPTTVWRLDEDGERVRVLLSIDAPIGRASAESYIPTGGNFLLEIETRVSPSLTRGPAFWSLRGWSGDYRPADRPVSRRSTEPSVVSDHIGWILDDLAGLDPQPNTRPNRLPGPDERAIAEAISRCWSIDVGSAEAAGARVQIAAIMNGDGTVRSARIVNIPTDPDPDYRAAAESARRALLNPACQPLPIPRGGFDDGAEYRLNLDPRRMF